MASVIAWDIETVPDLKGFAAANGHEGKSDADIRTAMGDKFPKHIYHSIICIGALVAHQENDSWRVDARSRFVREPTPAIHNGVFYPRAGTLGHSINETPTNHHQFVLKSEIQQLRLFRLQMPEKIFPNIRIIQLIRM